MGKKKRGKTPRKPFQWTMHHVFATLSATCGFIGRLRADLWSEWQRRGNELTAAAAEENGLKTVDEALLLPDDTPLGEKTIRLRQELEEWCHQSMPALVSDFGQDKEGEEESGAATTILDVTNAVTSMSQAMPQTPELLTEFRARCRALGRILDEEYTLAQGKNPSPETAVLGERAAAAFRDLRDWFSRGPGGGKK